MEVRVAINRHGEFGRPVLRASKQRGKRFDAEPLAPLQLPQCFVFVHRGARGREKKVRADRLKSGKNISH